jgi:hypothetical protein
LYLFDLPFRKAVAFIGSGPCTLEGIKDREELFYKITDLKEIDTLKSWFTGYYEFAEPLTEEFIQEYEQVYPYLKQREIRSRAEKKQLMALTTGGFKWDRVSFKNQFFGKDDYLTLSHNKTRLATAEILAARAQLLAKLSTLCNAIKPHLQKLKLAEDPTNSCSSLYPTAHADGQVKYLGLAYGRSEAALKKQVPPPTRVDVMCMQVVIQQKEVGIWLVLGLAGGGQVDRVYFKDSMTKEDYRKQFFTVVLKLGTGYWIEIAGDRKPVDYFTQEETLWEFTKADNWQYYDFIIGKNYGVGSNELSNDLIAETITQQLDKLILVYQHLVKTD